jgi:hypothetical protein
MSPRTGVATTRPDGGGSALAAVMLSRAPLAVHGGGEGDGDDPVTPGGEVGVGAELGVVAAGGDGGEGARDGGVGSTVWVIEYVAPQVGPGLTPADQVKPIVCFPTSNEEMLNEATPAVPFTWTCPAMGLPSTANVPEAPSAQ